MKKVMAYIEFDSESGNYIGLVPGLVGAHTQAETLEELYQNLQEVVSLVLEEMQAQGDADIPEFVGIHQIEVTP
jgi:predicted RNase H-like HicB family nuclease